jgi:hypothetical protein
MKCILSGSTEKLIEVTVDDKKYHVSEEIADEMPLKKIIERIREKLKDESNKSKELLTKMEDMAKSMGMSKEELIKILGGSVQTQNQTQIQTVQQIKVKDQNENGLEFKEVDGSLKSTIKANINLDEGVSAIMPAYTDVKDENKQSVREVGKKIAKVGDNVIIEKSNMGTTTIAVINQNAHEVNKSINAVDSDGKLIRGKVFGKANANSAKECPVCKSSGINTVNHQVCPKCKGVGYIYL